MLKEYRTLKPYYRDYRFHYLGGLFFLTLTNGGQLLTPQFIRLALNHVTEGAIDLSFVGKLVLLMIGLSFLIGGGRFLWRKFIMGSSRRIESRLREQLFYHLTTMDAAFFGRHKTGDIMALMTNDMNAIRMASGMALVAFTDGLFMTVAIVVILFSQYPRIALLTIIPLPILTLLVLLGGIFLRERFKQVREDYARVSTKVQESLSGIRVIKTFGKEEKFLQDFERINEGYIRSNLSLVKTWGLMMPLVGFLTGLTSCLLLLFGGEMVILGELGAGDFVAVLSYLGMLAWPLMGAGWTVNLLQGGAASLKRINAILEEKPRITSPPQPAKIEVFQSLELKNLDFSYGQGPLFEDLSLEIKEGMTLGILGKTGGGKSTLVNLLPRILESPRGTIRLNGRDIHDLDLSELRRMVHLIPQDSFLFSASIEENIRLGVPEGREEELQDLLDLTALKRDLKHFPRGLATEVGEKGVSLSGGQKQRVALTRALLLDPQVLILDDALSAVDTKTEEQILRAFFTRRRGKTNIIISHRVSTLMNADQIIVLERGKICQAGSHRELITQEGLYQSIYKLQSLDDEDQTGN